MYSYINEIFSRYPFSQIYYDNSNNRNTSKMVGEVDKDFSLVVDGVCTSEDRALQYEPTPRREHQFAMVVFTRTLIMFSGTTPGKCRES